MLIDKRRSLSLQNNQTIIEIPLPTPESPKKRRMVKNQPIYVKKKETYFFSKTTHFNQEANDFDSYVDSIQIIKEGYLYQSGRIYIQLTRSSIKEYKDDQCTTLMRILSLKELDFTVSQDRQFIKLQFPLHNLVIYQAKDFIEAKIWVGYIKILEDKYKNYIKQRIQIKEFPHYFGSDLISEDYFLKIVETGDLLLFETNNTGARLQRMVTKSKFDHVGIAVKVASKYLFIFDANADSGVTFMEWSQFIEINDLYEKVSLRKLQGCDRVEVENKVVDFLQQVHGKPYEVTISKLFRRKSLSPSQKADSYFCSELVAKAYKYCGLLQSDKASSSYWPVEFTKQLPLSEQAKLMDPICVILKKHLLPK